MASSKEELEAAYKKVCKTLDGEKRAAIKKAKGTKGKKAKEAIAAVESEYAQKQKDLETKLEQDIAGLSEGGATGTAQDEDENKDSSTTAAENKNPSTEEEPMDAALSEKERKLEKARRKKLAKKEKELQRQREIEEADANAGPTMRSMELEQIEAVLTPLNLQVAEVEADGHCLYRAVAAQSGKKSYMEIRNLCASTLAANQDEFAPFCEYTDSVSSFDEYVEQVRSSAEWGGHLELRALGMALDRPILVYSVQNGSKPLGIHDERNDGEKDPIRVSYHLHYYALGEHYNQVVPKV